MDPPSDTRERLKKFRIESGKKKRGRVPKAIVSKIKEIVDASPELYLDEI